ncbi:MAG: glutamate--tRNA ligase, partial [Candidatus Latescibacteria bacterium]|nr:glutamate--tRNA ligase [Candidatus Latescibacterota bacterium]
MKNTERLRFAPSPTGDLHIGGARSALFNWLYARKTGGKFLLRIEDTDTERSSEKALKSILESLEWLGIKWDEEPVFQSQRGDLYRRAVVKLLDNGCAYRCFCTKEELDADREKARREKLDYHYSGKCRNLDEDTIAAYTKEGHPYTVRFRVPEGETSFDDLVHGKTTFRNDTIGDFIIARANGSPVYLLGVAVDDA